MSINFKVQAGQPRSLLAQVLTAIVGIGALILGLMFSAVFLVILVVAGLILWGYFWWKTRALRKQIREQMAAQQGRGFAGGANDAAGATAAADGDIIEGEAVRVVDEHRRLDEHRGE